MKIWTKIQQRGLGGSLQSFTARFVRRPYRVFRTRAATEYRGPTEPELLSIEAALENAGLQVFPVSLDPAELNAFRREYDFAQVYEAMHMGEVADEKSLEHFIAWKFCGLPEFTEHDIYVDVAAGGSPWAKSLREKRLKAYSIDLQIPPQFSGLEYYQEADATAMPWNDATVRACSLQCAYEMFAGEDDRQLLREFRRVLQPGGVVVISPLYMHTHHCGYATPEHYGGGAADAGAVEYIRRGLWGIPFSRKYSAELLKERVFDLLNELGLEGRVYRLMNKQELGQGIYLHFFLVITRPG